MDDGLRTIYGETFLQFVLGREDIDGRLTPAQIETVSALHMLANSETAEADAFTQYLNLTLRLTYYVPEYGRTIAWQLRRQSGGDFHELEQADDDLTRSLLLAARDAWPVFLLLQPLEAGTGAGSVSSFSNPAVQRATKLLLEDDAFKRHFSDAMVDGDGDDDPRFASVQATFSTGHGYGFQAALLPDILIKGARARQLISGSSNSIEEYLELVPAILAEAQDMAQGKEVLIPRLIGLANIHIDEGVEITTSVGILRAPRESDFQLVGERAHDSWPITAIFETKIPMRMFVHDRSDRAAGDAYYERMTNVWGEYRRRTERPLIVIGMILLMASSENNLLVPAPVAYTTFGPLEHGLVMSFVHKATYPFGIGQLDPDAVERVRTWAQKIELGPPASLELGIRRLVAAATRRNDAVDGFIDAVICWENMFGGSPETTFRVCSALAFLIEPTDNARRTALFSELKTLYRVRSRVVHGSTELDMTSAAKYRTRAIMVAIEAMRRLYEYPDLMALKDSLERGQNLILAAQLKPEEADESE